MSSKLERGALVIVIACCVAVVVACSNVGTDLGASVFLAATLLITSVGWLTWFAVLASGRRSGDLPAFLRKGLLVPACIGLTVVLIQTDIPLRLRVYLSANALVAFGRASDAAAEHRREPGLSVRSVGLFDVIEFERYDDEFRFLTTSCGLGDMCGIIYSPSGPPPTRGEDEFRHLYGPWWRWRQSW